MENIKLEISQQEFELIVVALHTLGSDEVPWHIDYAGREDAAALAERFVTEYTPA